MSFNVLVKFWLSFVLFVRLCQCHGLTLLPPEVLDGGGGRCHLRVVRVILVSYTGHRARFASRTYSSDILVSVCTPSMYSHGIKKRPFLTYVEMCFYHIILECPYEGVSFVFADKFTNILTILLDKCTTIDFCTMQ